MTSSIIHTKGPIHHEKAGEMHETPHSEMNCVLRTKESNCIAKMRFFTFAYGQSRGGLTPPLTVSLTIKRPFLPRP